MGLRFSALGTIGNGGRIAGSSGAILPSDKNEAKEKDFKKAHDLIMYQKTILFW